jgi:hypothetical protein
MSRVVRTQPGERWDFKERGANLSGQITKDRLGKLFIPFVVLGSILLGQISLGIIYSLGIGINEMLAQIAFFLPQYVFPYDGYYRNGPFIYGEHKSLHPLGLPGMMTSLIHWMIVILIYYWFSRKLSIGKSLLVFISLGIVSLVFINLLLGSIGWNFSIDGP